MIYKWLNIYLNDNILKYINTFCIVQTIKWQNYKFIIRNFKIQTEFFEQNMNNKKMYAIYPHKKTIFAAVF